MKRSFVLFLVTALAVMLSAGLVCAQTFSRMSFTVPSGWTATEDSSGVVTVTDGTDSILIQLGSMGTSTLQQIANSYYSRYSGTTSPSRGSSGNYYFSSKTSAGVRMFHEFYDHNSRSKVPEGYYFWECYVGDDTTALIDVFYDEGIYGSLEFHPNSSGNTTPTPTTTGGTVQTFSRMKIKIPDGYRSVENSNNTMVDVIGSGNGVYLKFLVAPKNGQTLAQIAQSWANSANGNPTPERNTNSGWYKFLFTNNEGTTSTVYIDDSTTNSRVPSGWYWLQLVTDTVPSEIWGAVYGSVVITVSPVADTPSPDPTPGTTSQDTTPDTTPQGTTSPDATPQDTTQQAIQHQIINNYYGDHSGNQGNQNEGNQVQGEAGAIGDDASTGDQSETNNTDNNETNKSNELSLGGGGGCSAGFGSLALLALCSAFIVRKSR